MDIKLTSPILGKDPGDVVTVADDIGRTILLEGYGVDAADEAGEVDLSGKTHGPSANDPTVRWVESKPAPKPKGDAK